MSTAASGRESLLVYGLVTLPVVAAAFGAYDDITTDLATTGYRVEWSLLAACALWGGLLGARLVWKGPRALGVVSLLLLAGAIWGRRGIHYGITPSVQPEYLVTAAAVLWFLALSVILLVIGARASGVARRFTFAVHAIGRGVSGRTRGT